MNNGPPAVAALICAVFLAAIAISCYCFPELAAQMNGFYSAKDYRSMVKWLAIGSVLMVLASAILFVILLVAQLPRTPNRFERAKSITAQGKWSGRDE